MLLGQVDSCVSSLTILFITGFLSSSNRCSYGFESRYTYLVFQSSNKSHCPMLEDLFLDYRVPPYKGLTAESFAAILRSFASSFYLCFLLIERPSTFRVSVIKFCFRSRSNCVSVANEGAWFTSISHGFSYLSTRMSNPSTSKHIESVTSSLTYFP